MEEAGVESSQENPARERVRSAHEPHGTQRRNAEVKTEAARLRSVSASGAGLGRIIICPPGKEGGEWDSGWDASADSRPSIPHTVPTT